VFETRSGPTNPVARALKLHLAQIVCVSSS